MQKTANYNLNKPEAGDPIRVADFNANADIIDTALAGKANAADLTALGQTVSALMQGGVGRAAWGSYVGDDTYGKNNPVKLEVGFKPVLAIVSCDDYMEETTCPMILCRDQTCAVPIRGLHTSNEDPLVHVTWGEDYVSWYSTISGLYQNNRDPNKYCWAVIGFSE